MFKTRCFSFVRFGVKKSCSPASFSIVFSLLLCVCLRFEIVQDIDLASILCVQQTKTNLLYFSTVGIIHRSMYFRAHYAQVNQFIYYVEEWRGREEHMHRMRVCVCLYESIICRCLSIKRSYLSLVEFFSLIFIRFKRLNWRLTFFADLVVRSNDMEKFD